MPQTVRGLKRLEARARRTLRGKAKFPTGLTPATLRRLEAQCISTYCNPGCKNTVFSTRKNTAAMKRNNAALAQNMDKDKTMQKLLIDLSAHSRKAERNVLWHKGSPPLVDNFYKYLDPKDVKAMKQKGAKSGCTIMLPDHVFSMVSKTMNDLAN